MTRCSSLHSRATRAWLILVVPTTLLAGGACADSAGVASPLNDPAAVAEARVVRTGTLQLTVSGVPGVAAISVTGPSGYVARVTGSTSLTGLANGTYTVTATAVVLSGTTYTPVPASQQASIAKNGTTGATVTYTGSVVTPPPPSPPPPSSSSLNLRIAGMYLTQTVQTMDGRVPLVAGKNAVLRVFAMANAGNAAQPTVRARFFRNSVLVSTITAPAAGSSVPTAVNEATSSASWNIAVPASLLQPGLSVVADVDPTNSVAEFDEADNQFPVSGAGLALDVRVVPPLAVTFVPVLQSPTGQQGVVTDGNKDQFLADTRQLHPVAEVTSTVHAPYTTSYALGSDGSGWGAVINELWALRAAEGGTSTYYGVVRTTYNSGVAGIGYVGAPTALGWDFLPSANGVVAHELGHTWGRQHAPCGGVSGADGAYPYAGGSIGAYGFNMATGQVVSNEAKDLMGYCGSPWISDYTYRGVLDFRRTGSAMMASAMVTSGAQFQPSLLLWGRITADGRMVLEPAVSIDARPVLPERAGRYTVQGTDADGRSLFSLSFDPEALADGPAGAERGFAFVVPVSAAMQAALASVRLRGEGRSVTTAVANGEAEAAVNAASLEAAGSGRARLRWNASRAPMIVVRDPATGQVLSFARGGDVTVWTSRAELDLDTPRRRVRGPRASVRQP